MAYYGVTFNNGDELLHYGVKGMKWGKKVFGKVKGVFGKGWSVAGKAKDVLTAKGDLQKGLAKTALKTELYGKQTANISKPSTSPAKPSTVSSSPGVAENNGDKPKKRYKKGVVVVEDGYVGNTHYVKTEYSNKAPVGKKTTSQNGKGFYVPTIDPVWTSQPWDNGGYGYSWGYKNSKWSSSKKKTR